MGLDVLLEGLALLLYWRAVLCMALAAAVALVVVTGNPWFTFGQGLGFILAGFGVGVWLEERAISRKHPRTVPAVPTSTLTLNATLLVSGGAWGLASGFAGRPAVTGVIGLVLAGTLVALVIQRTASSAQRRPGLLILILMFVGHGLGGLLKAAFQEAPFK